MTSFIDAAGQRQALEPKLEHYAEAFSNGLSLRQFYTQKFGTDESKYGNVFDQVLANSGLFLKADKHTGLKPPTVASFLSNSGGADIGMALTRPDGTNALTITGRLLFPAVIMELADAFLVNDDSSYNALFDSMVAITQASDSPHDYQPMIDRTGPRNSRAQPISQLAEPVNMATITLSERSRKLPTWSIGLEISDEAARASTLDLVGIAIREQALGERSARVNEAIKNLVDGDVDLGISALSAVDSSTFDSDATAGDMTNKGWIKILREKWMKQTYSHVICDIDAYLAIENRIGRPVVVDNDGTGRLTSMPAALNPNFPTTLPVFLMESNALLGANTVVLLDRSKAIRKVTYTGASYNAVENYVMRRSTAFRFDFSEGYFRLFDNGDGWRKVILQ